MLYSTVYIYTLLIMLEAVCGFIAMLVFVGNAPQSQQNVFCKLAELIIILDLNIESH